MKNATISRPSNADICVTDDVIQVVAVSANDEKMTTPAAQMLKNAGIDTSRIRSIRINSEVEKDDFLGVITER